MRTLLAVGLLGVTVWTGACAHREAARSPAPVDWPRAALIVTGAASTPEDVARLQRAFGTTFGVEEVEVMRATSSPAEILARTQKVATTIRAGGRLWLGFVGEVVEGEGGLPTLRPGGDAGPLGIAEWLHAARPTDGDAVLLIDGTTRVDPLHFELLTFDVPNVAVLAGLRAPDAKGLSFEDALARASEGGPKVDANADGRISGLEALRYLRFIAEPPLHVQFAARGDALSDAAPLFGERRAQ